MFKKFRFLENLFSVRNYFYNNIMHKIIYIFGIKISIKTKINKKVFFKLQEIYRHKEKELKKKKTINVVFMLSLISMFPARPLFEYLLKNKNRYKYDVKILIVPDQRFGLKNAISSQLKAYEELSAAYGADNILVSSVDGRLDTIDIKNLADIIIPALPYDITHPKYSLYNLINLGILPALVNYGYFRSIYDRNLIVSNTYSMYWKVFTENNYNLQEFKNFQQINGKNCVLTGYCKLDFYESIKNTINKKDRKVIMISPHHSVEGGYNSIMHLSNFYKYADLFLKLPELYPDIDFIFRPHPALFFCLERKNFWGSEKVEKYIKKMKSYKNVRYSDGGDYLRDFAESDALIQDCGSFLVDYFYTKKPQCYMLKNKEQINETFSDFGKLCLENVYKAYNSDDIINFINEVVINENDYMKDQRDKFAEAEVMINYPNVSEKIVDLFNQIFGANK